jgi:hypothetical protein
MFSGECLLKPCVTTSTQHPHLRLLYCPGKLPRVLRKSFLIFAISALNASLSTYHCH